MATDPFVTGGSSGVLVHDLTPYSSAQDAKDLDSQALLPGHPGLKYGSGIFHGRSDRGAGVESGNASATMRDPRCRRIKGVDAGLLVTAERRKGRVEYKRFGGCDRYNSRAALPGTPPPLRAEAATLQPLAQSEQCRRIRVVANKAG